MFIKINVCSDHLKNCSNLISCLIMIKLNYLMRQEQNTWVCCSNPLPSHMLLETVMLYLSWAQPVHTILIWLALFQGEIVFKDVFALTTFPISNGTTIQYFTYFFEAHMGVINIQCKPPPLRGIIQLMQKYTLNFCSKRSCLSIS